MTIGREIDQLIERALGRAGFMPRPVGDLAPDVQRLVLDAGLARTPPRDWPAVLLELWRRGSLYLEDGKSRVSPRADITARQLIVADTSIGAFASITGERVVLERSKIDSHCCIEGPTAIVLTLLQPHVVVGPHVMLLQSAVMPMTKVQRFVVIERSAIGSCTAIEGGTHPEKLPLGPSHRVVGVRIGPDCWIGQQVSISAGAVIGAGVTVLPFTSVTRPVPDHVIVAGAPARTLPIDANLRGLDAEQAREEGRQQGHSALRLPVFGRGRGSLATPTRLVIEYPDHGVLRDLAAETVLAFQCGAFEATIPLLFPGTHPDVRWERGATVRFIIDVDRSIADEVDQLQRGGPGIAPQIWPQIATWSLGPPPSTGETIVALIRSIAPTVTRVDPDAPFYAIGLDSMGIAELAARIETAFGISAPDPFVFNTVHALASEVDRCRSGR